MIYSCCYWFYCYGYGCGYCCCYCWCREPRPKFPTPPTWPIFSLDICSISMTGGALNPKRFPLLFGWLLLCPTPSGLFGRLMPRPPSWFLLSRPYEAPFIGDASKREFCLSSSSGCAWSGCWFIKLLLDGCYLSESIGSFGGCWCFLDVTDCLRCWLLLPPPPAPPCPTPRSP